MNDNSTDNNHHAILLEGGQKSREPASFEEKLFDPEEAVSQGVIEAFQLALNAQNLDLSKTIGTKTWRYNAYDWVSNRGTLVAKESPCTISLIKLPIVNRPYFRLYSTYYSEITSQNYKTRSYSGGRNPRFGGYLRIDIYFTNSSGGFIEGWEFDFKLYCNDSSREIEERSSSFSTDFYDEITTAPNCSASFRRVVKC